MSTGRTYSCLMFLCLSNKKPEDTKAWYWNSVYTVITVDCTFLFFLGLAVHLTVFGSKFDSNWTDLIMHMKNKFSGQSWYQQPLYAWQKHLLLLNRIMMQAQKVLLRITKYTKISMKLSHPSFCIIYKIYSDFVITSAWKEFC